MKRWLGGITCVLLLAACGDGSPPAAPTSASPPSPAIKSVPVATVDADAMAHYDGYGDVRFGMDEASFDKAWGGELKGAPERDSTCFYKTPKWVTLSADFAFMFEDGRFVRYDVGTAKEAAPGGGKVGMDAKRISALYGAGVQIQPHKYVDGAEYLRVEAPHGKSMLVFETDPQGKVTRWHVGVPPQVDYVEGCG
ncbi:hypothetical protein ACVWWQ_003210 [Rhodanobacter sp. TND4EL1]